MIIKKILKKLTPERIQKEVETIQNVKLPPELQKWVKEYKKVGERDEFLWKWMYKAVQLVTAPTVSKKYQKSLWEIKTLIIMFITLLDDIADKTNNEILLNELLRIPSDGTNIKFHQLTAKEKRYLTFTTGLWDYVKKTIKKYPRYKEFRDIFEYDIDPVLNEMKYACLVNKNPYLINKIEYDIYMPYNMQSFVSYTVDLMCSPRFYIRDLSILREIIWFLQKMSKIGNWISTWEREVKDNDFTSGVFAHAIDSAILTVNELKQRDRSEIIQIIKKARIENNLLREWEQCYVEIQKLSTRIKSVDTKIILLGSEKFLTLHLVSRGYI